MEGKESKEERAFRCGDIVVIQDPGEDRGNQWLKGGEQDKTISLTGEVLLYSKITQRYGVFTRKRGARDGEIWWYPESTLKSASKFKRKRYHKQENHGKKVQEGSAS